MAALHRRRVALLAVALLLLPFHAVAVPASDADHLVAARSELSDPAGALSGWAVSSSGSLCRWPHVACAGNSTSAVVLSLASLSLVGGFPAALCWLRSLEQLDLSGNSLSGPLPACLAALPALVHLNLAANNFSGEVPAAYGGGFGSLAVLNLVQNSLSGEFPGFLANLTALQELLLAYNPFSPSPLPERIGDLAALRVLYLASCSLNGKIPSSIGKLSNLVNLDLSSNNLSAEIPRNIGNLSSLVQIELFSNQLTGSIPEGIGALKKLRFLDISMNHLTGVIPEDMFAAPILESVHMYQNNLTGRLPATLGAAAALADLRIFVNQIEGPIPPELGKSCPLELLDMSDNRLSGPIPATLCASGKLNQLMLLNNELDGAIPAELGQCRTLLRIRLQNNRLSGDVPAEVWGLPGVNLLELRDNALSGTINSAIAGAKNLSKLLIQDNRFTGVLPDELGNLSELHEVLASNNNFSGPLPLSLAGLSSLYLLDLSYNSLSGVIPPGMGRMKKLSQLILSHNHLAGIIPSELGDIHGMNALDLSNNELSGEVPVQLLNLRLTNFNLSYNKLTGSVPLFFDGFVDRGSFLGNPGLCFGISTANGDSNSNRRAGIQLASSILIASAVVLLLGLAWFTYKYRVYKRRAAEIEGEKAADWALTSFHRVEFREKDIVNSLDENNVIGRGAAGKVYKAVVGPRSETMAVKKLWASGVGRKNMDTFEAEVATLSKVRHKNIVKLFCCVTNRDSQLLVYEYMPNGSLGDLLHSTKGGFLDWPTRYKIAVNAAEGLCYLHHDSVPSIVHRDVKSNNILLDAEFCAKVADFGLAKTLGNGPATMSVVAGSCGYIAPEYAYTLHVTEKSDIYSFGVVILELVTGKRPMAPEIGEMDLVLWACSSVEQNGAESVLDQRLANQFTDEMCKVMNIALLCVNNLPINRPPMRSVVKMLLEVRDENKLKAWKETPPAI